MYIFYTKACESDSAHKDASSLEKINEHSNDEKWYHILREVILPFFLAGLGMVGAGVIFDIIAVIIILKKDLLKYGAMIIKYFIN